MKDGKPTPQEIEAMATLAGVSVTAEVAARIAISVGPVFENFQAVSGTLPFDLEPATFDRVSRKCIGQ